MPDYFSHGVAAEIIYERLDGALRRKIDNKTLYLLGAQGGDVFFAYNVKPTKSNLGRRIHGEDARELFEKLCEGNLSYAAGFATHYALDSSLHPIIYAYENSKKSPFAHAAFERDLGLYMSRKFATRRQILPREKVLAVTGAVYDSIKKVEPLVTVTGVERCLKRHFTYSKFLFRTKKQDYKCGFDFAALSESVDEGIELGKKCVEGVLTKNIDGELFGRRFLQR